jgi:hypothetical protein
MVAYVSCYVKELCFPMVSKIFHSRYLQKKQKKTSV